MKNKLLTWIYMVSYYLGLFELFYYLNRNRPLVITYHNVLPDTYFSSRLIHLDGSSSYSAFMTQLSIIVKRFHVVTNMNHLKRSCLITFDDGYRNHYLHVMPILDDFNLKGLFFVPACYFEKEDTLWVDQLLMWVSYVPYGTYIILSNEFQLVHCTDRFKLWQFIYDSILQHPTQIHCIQQLLKETDEHYSYDRLREEIDDALYTVRFKPMSIAEIDEIKHRGHKIGCHSFNHYILAKLDSNALETDFIQCSKYIKQYNTLLYSYPFGGNQEISEREMNLVRKYGYAGAFVNYKCSHARPYAIGRISLNNLHDRYTIEAKLSGFETFLKKILFRH